MKKIFALLLAALLCFGVLAACTTNDDAGAGSGTTGGSTSSDGGSSSGGGTINLYSFTVEYPDMVDRYLELTPDFNYSINRTVIATDGGGYQTSLDQALAAGGSSAPDTYAAEKAFVLKYTQGDASSYAATFTELGIADATTKINDADIAPYAVEIGTRGGDLVALPFQMTGGAMIYRRSIANEVFGTDDPAEVASIVGPGWDKFWAAAEQLKEAGYPIVSGDGDLWHTVWNASETGWIVNGKLNIDPAREEFFDIALRLKEGGHSNNAGQWSEAWFADISKTDKTAPFAYFGPAWLINYVMAGNSRVYQKNADGENEVDEDGNEIVLGNGSFGDWAIAVPHVGFSWGGTWVMGNKNTDKKDAVAQLIEWITLDTSRNGLQWHWANGTLYPDNPTKDAVASYKIMNESNGSVDFLGGQDMFDIFVPAGEFTRGDNLSQYDEDINTMFTNQVAQYVEGHASKEEALANFKQAVSDLLGIDV